MEVEESSCKKKAKIKILSQLSLTDILGYVTSSLKTSASSHRLMKWEKAVASIPSRGREISNH